ncbi:MAG TPA: riboflavin biosynthesis protein RibD, partial [Prolixibacteraceae bacterium]|nr:riboflavin biosynthesis protein RibD [Prolixibacteraceae bacterium]
MQVDHSKYMSRCLELARLAEGHTAPNPMVGSVIVHNGKIIGEGFHQKAGMPHAEVNAIRSVKDR